MKAFENVDVKSVKEAVGLLQKFSNEKKQAAVVGGGSEYLQLMKVRVATPDYIVNLKTIPGLNYIKEDAGGFRIGALATLSELEEHKGVQEKLLFLSQAAGEAASPQIRNAGTVAGNLCQRPFCWYFRSASHVCLRKGGEICYSVSGDNRYHAILGGGPSYIVHPSDLAPALVALDARIKIAGPAGEKTIPLEKFFVTPQVNARRENILGTADIVTEIQVPHAKTGSKGFYYKARERQAWDHAIVSVATVVQSAGGAVRDARVVLGGVAPIPWRLPEVERMLTGQRITEELAAKAGEASVSGARALAKNAYKIPLTRGVVRRAILEARG
jgi:xanthine dehydrogenase YagS FAD-binding subunit